MGFIRLREKGGGSINRKNSTFFTRPFSFISESEPRSVRSWSRDIKATYKNQCIISGVSQKEKPLVAHHLFSKKDYPLLSFSLFNGVPIQSSIDVDFHRKYGIHTTPSNFIDFVAFHKFENTDISEDSRIIICNWVVHLMKEMR